MGARAAARVAPASRRSGWREWRTCICRGVCPPVPRAPLHNSCVHASNTHACVRVQVLPAAPQPPVAAPATIVRPAIVAVTAPHVTAPPVTTPLLAAPLPAALTPQGACDAAAPPASPNTTSYISTLHTARRSQLAGRRGATYTCTHIWPAPSLPPSLPHMPPADKRKCACVFACS